jgi:hypothetical protein
MSAASSTAQHDARRCGGRVLLTILIVAFAPRGLAILTLDDTTERHRDKPIAVKGSHLFPQHAQEAEAKPNILSKRNGALARYPD